MAKKGIKPGPLQRSLSTNVPPLVLFSGEWVGGGGVGTSVFAAKLLDFEISVKVKFLMC